MRGIILRDPTTGPGLLMIEGRQYWFSLDDLHGDKVHPRPGLAVDVKLNHAGEIVGITALPEPLLVREQKGRLRGKVKEKGINILSRIAAKCGLRGFDHRRW